MSILHECEIGVCEARVSIAIDQLIAFDTDPRNREITLSEDAVEVRAAGGRKLVAKGGHVWIIVINTIGVVVASNVDRISGIILAQLERRARVHGKRRTAL